MIIEKEELDKFKSIYKEEFGVEITDEQAEDKFGRLLDVLGTLFKYTEEKKWRKGDFFQPYLVGIVLLELIHDNVREFIFFELV